MQAEHDRKVREAEEKARKEEQRRANISTAQGGDGNFKPVEVEKVDRPISLEGMRNTTQVKSRACKDKIAEAVKNGIRTIEGVKIYQVWVFDITDAKAVPEEFRKLTR